MTTQIKTVRTINYLQKSTLQGYKGLLIITLSEDVGSLYLCLTEDLFRQTFDLV